MQRDYGIYFNLKKKSAKQCDCVANNCLQWFAKFPLALRMPQQCEHMNIYYIEKNQNMYLHKHWLK